MIRAYYDTAYLAKLYCQERGTEEVQAHLRTVSVLVTSVLARGELMSVLHRKRREGALSISQVREVTAQFREDLTSGVIHLCDITAELFDSIEQTYLSAPTSAWFRAADAIHLATATQQGFKEVYSNDRHLLSAAPLFGLQGVNVIPE